MSRSDEILRNRTRLRKQLNRLRTIARADSGADTVFRMTVDRHRESRAPHAGVDARLRTEIQALARFRVQRNAEISAADARQEVDHLNRHRFCGHDKIAFVFATFIVDEHDRFPRAQVVEDFGNRSKRGHAPLTFASTMRA